MTNKQNRIIDLWNKVVTYDDSRAFEELFYLLNTRLIKFSIFYVCQKEVAEELVSDMFVHCWVNRETLRHITNPETYLFISVKNRSFNYCKQSSAQRLVNIDGMTLVSDCSPGMALEKKELMQKLDQAIESLPQQCRIIFRLVKDEGMKHKEVAEILDISPRTVQTQLLRAMSKLSTIMVPYFADKTSSPVMHIALALLAASFAFI